MTDINQTRIIGGGKSTGVFITKDDMDQLIVVIAKAKAKDNLVAKTGVKTIGGSNNSLLDTPTIGSLSIRNFMEKLAQAYNMPEGKYYGVNKHGEFIVWAEAHEILGSN